MLRKRAACCSLTGASRSECDSSLGVIRLGWADIKTSSPQPRSVRFVEFARTDSASQFDRFLQPCPTTSRHFVIPAGNIRQQQADSSPHVSLRKSLRGCGTGATDGRFEVLREFKNDRWVPIQFLPPTRALSSVEVRAPNRRRSYPTSCPACDRPGSGFTLRHGLYGHPKPLYRHHCEGCKSGGDRDRRLWFRARRTRRKKRARRSCRRNRHCCSRGAWPELALARIAPSEPPSTRTEKSDLC